MTNIGPDFWGPPAWKFIHIVALAYPVNPSQQEKNNYKQFYTIIGDIIPCHFCRDHYKEHITKNPITDEILSNRKNLLHWTIDIHNEVNKITGKNVYDYETAIQLIQQHYIPNNNLDKTSNNNLDKSSNNNLDKSSNNNLDKSSNNNLDKTSNDYDKTTNNNLDKSDNYYDKSDNSNNTKYFILFILIVIIIMFLYYDTRKKTL